VPLDRIDAVSRPETLTDQTYWRIRRAIMGGHLAPGEKITVRGIASALGVSLTPAREAIGRLVAERVLVQSLNRTVEVPRMTMAAYEEIYRIRFLLEGFAAEMAIENIDAAGLKRLQGIHQEHSKAIERGDVKKVLQKNEDFHFEIYRASGMPTLVSIIEGLWSQIGPTLNLLYPRYLTQPKGNRNHRRAIEAIIARDGTALRQAIEQDLTDGAEHILAELGPKHRTARGRPSPQRQRPSLKVVSSRSGLRQSGS
jgi:DNA-binding GntR family transcriptional regulator